MSIGQDQVDAVGRLLRGNVAHLTILTKEQYGESLMCFPHQTQADHAMSPIAQAVSPATTPNNYTNLQERVYDRFWQPAKDSTWLSPALLGANDFYVDLWRPAQQMHGVPAGSVRNIFHSGRHYVAIDGARFQRFFLQRMEYYKAGLSKVVEIGAARQDLLHEAVKGLRVAMGVGVGVEVVEAALNDEATLASLLGGVIAEVDKAAIAAGIAFTAARIIGLGSVVGMFTLPALAAFIALSVVAGVAVNMLDERYGLKEDLQAALVAFFEWDKRQTERLSEWTSAQVENLQQSVDEAVDAYRQWLDANIESAGRHFDDVMERSMQYPSLASPEEIQSAAIRGVGLRFHRWVIGD